MSKANYLPIYVTGEELKNLELLLPRVQSIKEVAHGYYLTGADPEALDLLSEPNAKLKYIIELTKLEYGKKNEG